MFMGGNNYIQSLIIFILKEPDSFFHRNSRPFMVVVRISGEIIQLITNDALGCALIFYFSWGCVLFCCGVNVYCHHCQSCVIILSRIEWRREKKKDPVNVISNSSAKKDIVNCHNAKKDIVNCHKLVY